MDNHLNLGIIPDGNRRFAKKYNLSYFSAYKKGAAVLETIIKHAFEEHNVSKIAVYALSYDNLKKRSELELKALERVFLSYLKKLLSLEISSKIVGEVDELPSELKKLVYDINSTFSPSDKELYVAMAYDGQLEIINAIKKSDNHKQDFLQNLYFPYSLDLIIRTGNVQRLSGFFIYQSSYAELFFSEKLWPEFSTADLDLALQFYRSTQRNFGR